MRDRRRKFDVLVIGAGPAGIAAACCAAEIGAPVGLVDNNARAGGQIWRGGRDHPLAPDTEKWYARLEASSVEFLPGTEVFCQAEARCLAAESPRGSCELAYEKLILCTGARERFLPFPGWTLPNVLGAGGLQALVKSGLSVEGKKVVIAGSGPLLMAVAAYLCEHGGDVRLIAEQAPWSRLLRFGLSLMAHGRKAMQAYQLKRQLRGIPFRAGCWLIAAQGNGKLERVTLRSGNKTWEEPCDYLACGFHLVPNTELAVLLGCELRAGFVRVDNLQQTTVPAIFCAGEPTGIGGLELAVVEGQIAGYAAAGQLDNAREHFAERDRLRHFSISLQHTFSLRAELASLSSPDTIICRCEDVSFSRLRAHSSWRAAKLHTRCGMGPCQGRVCGPAVEFLFGWEVESVRPPIFPVSVGHLTETVGAAHE
ncbi:MAG TPA: FAD/NAD(P)-binding oxidoreductase [Candidatus Acidoferrales bacterium]|nr:FAD/NAD(P)-binding oxidoreductase [Candidatus Acidoferrales bacterium]